MDHVIPGGGSERRTANGGVRFARVASIYNSRRDAPTFTRVSHPSMEGKRESCGIYVVPKGAQRRVRRVQLGRR